MPNKNYLAGRRLEYEIMKLWQERGYETIRAAGSHGPYDIVAFRSDRVCEFIQAKRVSKETDGKRLKKAFVESTEPSKHYHQNLTVKVRGSRELIEWTI